MLAIQSAYQEVRIGWEKHMKKLGIQKAQINGSWRGQNI